LIAGNKQKLHLYAISMSLCVRVVLTFFLSYRWGYIGTTIATLVSISILAFLEYLFVYIHIFKLNIVSILSKPVISVAITGIFMYIFKEQLGFLTLFILSVVIYFLSLVIFRVFPKEDIMAVRGLLKGSFL